MTDQFPIAVFRRTTAHWHQGKVTTLFVRQSGQGPKLVLEQSNETLVQLGGEFTLALMPVADAEPPIIGIPPEFPELPTPELPPAVKPPIEMLPPEYQQPVHPEYKKPPGVDKPIYKQPGYPGVDTPIYKQPGYPGVKPPIEMLPEEVEPPIYGEYEKPVTPEVPPGVDRPVYEGPSYDPEA